MFISNKNHYKIIENLESFYEKEIKKLKQELQEAKDLKSVLSKLTDNKFITCDYPKGSILVAGDTGWEVELSESFAQYVEDLLVGGRVIKQDANKAILIEKDGTIKEGYTRQKCDKGYKYKLKRK